jgi:hypothetical protein
LRETIDMGSDGIRIAIAAQVGSVILTRQPENVGPVCRSGAEGNHKKGDNTQGAHDAPSVGPCVGPGNREIGVFPAEGNASAARFENRGDCDIVRFRLFDQAPFVWDRALAWINSPRECVKSGGVVLMACLALHDMTAGKSFLLELPSLIDQAAAAERSFVKMAVR